ncbi:MAG: type II secretion system protein M [Burkholderiales bacterium]|jgi:type II secretory pathway component PulM|nr:type II secretion system protein M [Burkholderiales bacterium]
MTTVPPTLERWRLQWQQRPRHERRFIIALIALVVVALLWLWLWLPLTQHLQQLQRELPFSRAQLEQAQRQFSESAGLNRQSFAPTTADVRAAVERTAARFNVAAAIVTLDVQQNTASVTLSALPFDTLVQWLEALQREEHFYVTAATLTPLANTADQRTNGQLRVELVIVRPSS